MLCSDFVSGEAHSSPCSAARALWHRRYLPRDSVDPRKYNKGQYPALCPESSIFCLALATSSASARKKLAASSASAACAPQPAPSTYPPAGACQPAASVAEAAVSEALVQDIRQLGGLPVSPHGKQPEQQAERNLYCRFARAKRKGIFTAEQ